MIEQRPLIGRERELEALAAACAEVGDGRGRCVLVTGEAGIGKSRLVAHALAQEGLGALAGAARSSVTEPYGPLTEVLRQHLRRTPDLADAWGALAPYLAPLLPEIGVAAEDAGEATLIEAILRALSDVASRGPVAVVLDDLHWADEATLLSLPRLAAGLREVPLLLVAVARDEVPADTHRLRRLRAELRRVAEPLELPLPPFEQADTARLAAAVAGIELEDHVVAALQERAHGIPFYVEQLAATLALQGRCVDAGALPLPESVLDAVLLRTEALSLAARNDLEIAAVLGQRCAIDHVPGMRRADAFAEALAAGFLVEEGPGLLAFRHALVREAVYESIPWTRRRSLHARVARLLEDAGSSPAERATHWLGAGEIERGRAALALAAVASVSVFAYRDAAALYERALDLDGGPEPARFELLEQLAVCAELAGDLAGSARAWREVIDGQRACGAVERVADAQQAIGRVLALRGSTERALAAWFAAADAYAACGQGESAARAQLSAADVLQATGRLRPALAAVESALADVSREASPELYSRARSLEGRVLGKLGETEQALESAQAGLEEALCVGNPVAAAAAYQAFAIVHENTGDLARASEAYEVAIDYCARTGVKATGDVCSACLCDVLRQRGDWRRSLALAQTILDDPNVDAGSRAVAAAIMSQIHACRGERRPARLRVMEAAPVINQIGSLGAGVECVWTLGRLELLEGSLPGALEHCREILRRWEASEDRHYSLCALAWTSGVFAAAGQAEDLHRVVRALATIAAASGSREALAMLARGLGEVAFLEGDAAAAVEHFRRAVDLHRELELPHDRGELLVSAAAAARDAGLEEQAREWLTDARIDARRLGARPLRAAAERALGGLGEGAATPGGAAGLTPRQLQVIRRVAEGLTNREIAVELYLSVRTVDMHVRHSLIALGCRSRLDAARKAGELGLLAHA
jgi:DNA-binding CsgD family transcriptional regulator/type II secretory pathway predicted ATPase ExeA